MLLGILKGRFRVLKSAIRCQDREGTDDIFSTCCVLHNILHAWDGLAGVEPDTDWTGANGNPEDGADHSAGLGHGGGDGDGENESFEEQLQNITLRDELVRNFTWAHANNPVCWKPKG